LQLLIDRTHRLDINIDKVLKLSDPSLIPIAFLNEIQQDEIYATIFEELRKKFNSHSSWTMFDEQKCLSPHLLKLHDDDDPDDVDMTDNDDDGTSITDDLTSYVSSEAHHRPGHDDYDTDLESGRSIRLNNSFMPVSLPLFRGFKS
jgi:hypothetical protein